MAFLGSISSFSGTREQGNCLKGHWKIVWGMVIMRENVRQTLLGQWGYGLLVCNSCLETDNNTVAKENCSYIVWDRKRIDVL